MHSDSADQPGKVPDLAPSTPGAAARQSQAVPNRRVLIVEDDWSSFRAMKMLLGHYGFDVTHAATTREAVRLLTTNPRFVFLDLMLPDGDGSVVLAEIRSRGMNSTVAVITGTNDPDRLERVRQLGADFVFHKPVDFPSLLAKLNSD